MASIHEDSKSPYWFCSFKGGDGKWKFKSTKILVAGDEERSRSECRDAALKVCEAFERAVSAANKRRLSATRAREIINEIIEHSGGEKLEHASIKEWYEKWLVNAKANLSPATHTQYTKYAEVLMETLGDRANDDIETLSAMDMQRLMDRLRKDGLSNKTINNYLKGLKVPLNDAQRLGVITENPGDRIKTLPKRKPVREDFTFEHIQKIMAVCNREWQGVVLFGFHHGMRLGDAARLRVKNIDFKKIRVRWIPDKAEESSDDKEMDKPLRDECHEYLLDSPIDLSKPDSFLFPNLGPKKMVGSTGLSNTFGKLIVKAGIDREGTGEREGKGRQQFKYSFHSLRHANASWHANNGTPIALAMEITGHRSEEVHREYQHKQRERDDELRTAINSTPRLITKPA